MSNPTIKTNYQKARDLIVGMVIADAYRIGDAIPSVDKLSKMLGIGRMSVQQAVKILEKEGVFFNIKGSGCYLKTVPVADPDENQGGSIIPFSCEAFSSQPLKSGKVAVRFGLPSVETEYFGGHWKKCFSEYQKGNSGVAIETVDIADMNDLKSKLVGGDIDVFQIPLDVLPSFADAKYLFPPQNAGDLIFPRQKFFKPYYDASIYNGISWGIPLAANTSCLFFNKDYMDIIDSVFPVDGFWDFLFKLEDCKKTGCFKMDKVQNTKCRGQKKRKAEAFISNGYQFSGFFANCPGTLSEKDFETDDFVDSPEFLDFVKNFGRYYLDPKIFHPDVNEDSKDPISYFTAGRTMMSFGNSSWIPVFRRAGFNSFGILPEPIEENGFSRLNGVINVISSFSYHPSECLDIVNYLGGLDVQKSFAEQGRAVAHREACGHLKIKGMDDQSISSLMRSLDNGKLSLNANNFAWKVLCPAMHKWHLGEYSTEEFCEVVRKKKQWFYNALKMRISFANDPGRISTAS